MKNNSVRHEPAKSEVGFRGLYILRPYETIADYNEY